LKIEIALLCHAERSEASLLTKPLKGENTYFLQFLIANYDRQFFEDALIGLNL